MGRDGGNSAVAVIRRSIFGAKGKCRMAFVVEEGEVDARDDAQAVWGSFVEVGRRGTTAPRERKVSGSRCRTKTGSPEAVSSISQEKKPGHEQESGLTMGKLEERTSPVNNF